MRPDDPLFQFAESEPVATPEKPENSNGASLIGRLKCWWTKRHPKWMYMQAIDSGVVARICERCGKVERGEQLGDKVYFRVS